ncbi:MAG: hypothetical protein U0Q15_12900 [Kineosporiaceae bacterium]
MAVVVAGSLVLVSAGSSVAAKKPRVRPAASVSPSGTASGASSVGPLSVNAALEQARASGVAVAVASLTDEMSTTVAEPSGLLTMSLYAEPHNVLVSGSWQSVDPQVAVSGDGRVRPKVSVSGLSFSGAGSGAGLVRVPTPAGDVDFDWPHVLSAPVLSGDSVRYAEALTGVDLVLRATPDGFVSVLVVKTSAALALLRDRSSAASFTVRGPAQVLETGSGGVRVVTTAGRVLFEAGQGLMWDSAGDGVAVPSGVDEGSDRGVIDPSSGPSRRDRVGEVLVSAIANRVQLLPEEGFFATAPVLPVFIDPPMGLHQTGRLLVSDFNEASWGWTNYSRGEGVGLCGPTGSCSRDRDKQFVKRQYFQFDRAYLSGKQVQSATFRAFLTHSVACSTTATTVELRRSGVGISPSSRWAGVKDRDAGLVASAAVGSAYGSCGSQQWVEWPPSGVSNSNLTKLVADLADGRMSSLAVYLKGDERNSAGWRRFRHDASLQITYAPKPGLPYDLGAWWSTVSSSRTCASSNAPAVISTLTPVLSAIARLDVAPTGSSDQGKLRTRFGVQRRMSDGSWPEIWTQTVPSSGTYTTHGQVQRVTVPAGKLADGGVYRLSALNVSHTDSPVMDISGRVAVGCYFRAWSGTVKAPVVAQGGVYTLCSVPGLMEALNPREDESYGCTEEVSGRAA